MLIGHAALAHIRGELGIGGDRRSGLQFRHDIRLQRRLLGDLAGQADAEDHRLHVVVGAQVVEQHRGRRQRIGTAETHRAAAVGSQMHRTHA